VSGWGKLMTGIASIDTRLVNEGAEGKTLMSFSQTNKRREVVIGKNKNLP